MHSNQDWLQEDELPAGIREHPACPAGPFPDCSRWTVPSGHLQVLDKHRALIWRPLQ